MGGEIGVRDRPGGGAVFWFNVMLDAAEGAPAAPAHGDLNGARILVVDDIELNRSIFVRQLATAGALADEAESGPAALRLLYAAAAAGRPYDIVLTDHMMPDMSGDVLAGAIRSDAGLAQPKLVLASSIGAPLKSEHAAQVGFEAFLTKPVRHQALIECLSGLMSVAAPVDMTASGPDADERAAATLAAGGRVLVAEDNEINIFLVRTILEAVGFELVVAVNGHEAIDAARLPAFRPDPDGRPDAGHGRADGDSAHPRARRRPGANAHRRHDRQRHARRPGGLPRRRDGRLHLQAVRAGRVPEGRQPRPGSQPGRGRGSADRRRLATFARTAAAPPPRREATS